MGWAEYGGRSGGPGFVDGVGCGIAERLRGFGE